jgi:hypothetical protein
MISAMSGRWIWSISNCAKCSKNRDRICTTGHNPLLWPGVTGMKQL